MQIADGPAVNLLAIGKIRGWRKRVWRLPAVSVPALRCDLWVPVMIASGAVGPAFFSLDISTHKRDVHCITQTHTNYSLIVEYAQVFPLMPPS